MDDVPSVISSRDVFEGRIFRVRVDRVRYDDGAVRDFDVVVHRGSYAIVATTADDRIVLVRQYRHAVGRALWEIPAGMAERGEELAAGALRELREETGYRAAAFRPLGSVYVTPGFCTEILHFFHASQLTAGDQELDADERITVASFTADEAHRLVESGQIADSKTLLALSWMRGPRGEIVGKTADK